MSDDDRSRDRTVSYRDSHDVVGELAPPEHDDLMDNDRATDDRVAAIQAHVDDAVRRATAELRKTTEYMRELNSDLLNRNVRLEQERNAAHEQLAAANERAEKAEAERDEAKARIAERDEERVLLYRIIGAIEHAYALNTYVELEPGETAPTIESLWTEVRELRGVAPDAAADGHSATQTGAQT